MDKEYTSHDGRRTHIDKWFERMSHDPAVAYRVMAEFGVEVNSIGQRFRCPLPGHGGTDSWAELWRDRNGRIMFHDLHAKEGEDNQWFTLPEVYATIRHPGNRRRRIRRLERGEQAIWWIRALVECGIVEMPPPPMCKQELPEGTPPEAHAVYQGFCYRLQIGVLYEPSQKAAPFADKFAMSWWAIGKRKFRTGFGWLREHEYVVEHVFDRKVPCRSRLFELAPV